MYTFNRGHDVRPLQYSIHSSMNFSLRKNVRNNYDKSHLVTVTTALCIVGVDMNVAIYTCMYYIHVCLSKAG